MSILYCSGICQHATIKSADEQAAGLQCTWVYGEQVTKACVLR